MALYYIGLGFLFTHELDAVTHSEWRLLFFLRDLPEATAASTFVALHVPLFGLILWLSQHEKHRVRTSTQAIVSVFMPIHAALHYRLSTHPEFTFSGPLSNSLVLGAAAFGIAHLVSLWFQRPHESARA